MKTKISTILILSIAFFVYANLSSCQKDKPCVHGTTEEDIPSGDLAKVPYTDATKLTFVRTSTKDTFVFSSQGWFTDFGSQQTQDDCYQIYKLQRKSIIFKSQTYSQSITLSLLFYYSHGDYMVIDFNNTTFSVTPINIRNPYSYDSLSIGSQNYYNIEYFKDQYQSNYNSPYGCYFNITHGILKMETSDGDKWELIRVQ